MGQDINQLAYKARVELYDNWNFEKAAYYFDKVIGKRKAPASAYSDYGWYQMLIGRYKEGLENVEKAAKMDPKDKQLVTWNAWAILWNRNFQNAKKWIEKALRIDPDYGEALYVASMIASEMGNHEEAIRLANKAALNDANWRGIIPYALAKSGNTQKAMEWAEKVGSKPNAFDAMLLVEVYAVLGEDDLSLKFLNEAYVLKHPFMPWIKFLPSITHLHNDSRFLQIVEKMNLPE